MRLFKSVWDGLIAFQFKNGTYLKIVLGRSEFREKATVVYL